MRKLFLIITILISNLTQAEYATFTLLTDFTRNKNIWGTYKIKKELLYIRRGKKTWNIKTKKKGADLIISKGKINLIRESVNEDQYAQIKTHKLAYRKEKKAFINHKNLEQEQWQKLIGQEIDHHIPHLDLKQGHITYDKLDCSKRKKGLLRCQLSGRLIAKKQQITAK